MALLLASDVEAGLTKGEAAERLARLGPNRLARAARPAYAAIVLRQFADPLVGLLIVAAAVSLAIGDRIEGAAIAAIVILNAALGFAQEAGAERAVLALRGTFEQRATAIRDGREAELLADELVVATWSCSQRANGCPPTGALSRRRVWPSTSRR